MQGEDSGTSTPATTAEPTTTAAATITPDDLDFSDIKKKKKSTKKKAAFDLEAFEKELNDSKSKSTTTTTTTSSSSGDGKGGAAEEDDDDGPEPDTTHLDHIDEAELGDDPFAHPGDAPVGVDAGNEAWLKSDRDYTYPEVSSSYLLSRMANGCYDTQLLTRFYASLHAANPALLSTSSRKRYTIAPPQLFREGNKKSIFANVTDICKKMHRQVRRPPLSFFTINPPSPPKKQPEHVIQFLFAEMGTTGSVDGAGRLVIKGRFQQKQIENVLRRYMVEYVTCKTCKSPDTLLTKENRIFFMACESCGSRRSVNAIKSGFQAQVGKRSKNKTG
jgi:translation initiation factor 2 subunit 2